jgi:triosephosphate isomerase
MLKYLGVKAVLIGHSERRRFFGETDEIIHQKIKMTLGAGLRPILAIGEELPDSHDVVPRVLADQLTRSLTGIPKKKLSHLIVAYEPVWAIGSGKADTSDNATRRAIYIRKLLTKLLGNRIADRIPILYGGSVTSKNAASFLVDDIRGMDGLLVGGASLRAEEFLAIARAISRR